MRGVIPVYFGLLGTPCEKKSPFSPKLECKMQKPEKIYPVKRPALLSQGEQTKDVRSYINKPIK